MRKFAVFDIDGTLYRWQLFHSLVQELTDLRVIQGGGMLNDAWHEWRGNRASFEKYEATMMNDVLFKSLPGMKTDIFEAACVAVVESTGHKVHRYTLKLLNDLKDQDYTIIAISGSQQELIGRFCAKYGFDIAIGAIYERDGDVFTGKISRPTYGHKAEILKNLVNEHDLTWQDSLAIGDTKSDIDILELVEQPIAFNPTIELLEVAKEKAWPIVIERKNLAYHLKAEPDGSIVLAKTDIL